MAKKLIHVGRVFELKQVNVSAPGGKILKHDVIFHRGAAVIVPVTEKGEFVLVRQYRTATHKMMWEFPAGTLEKGEQPLACAKREIIEEIGYEALSWKKLATFYPAPGVSTERMYLYLAKDLRPKHMQQDHDEFMEREVISTERLRKMIESGEVEDAKTILGFFFYLLRKK